MRAFIAITIPLEFREALAAQADRLGHRLRDLRWVPPGNLHLTLAFLGEIPSHSVDSIKSGLDAVVQGCHPFNLGFGSGGTFPPRGEPRVAWVRITGDLDEAKALQAAIAREMRELGLRVDARPFSPHVTLARIRRQATPSARIAIAHHFEGLDLEHLGIFTVPAIALMESDLTPDGAVYREVLEVELGGAGDSSEPRDRRFRLFGHR